VTPLFDVDTRSTTPIWDQIVTRLRFAIASGSLPAGEAIPSVRQLAVALRVNPNTVARAYRELEAQGLVETRQGRGTFVAEAPRRLSAAQRREALSPSIERLTSEARMLGVEAKDLAELVRQAAAKLSKGDDR
jgi:GntR family transcriptional regulator